MVQSKTKLTLLLMSLFIALVCSGCINTAHFSASPVQLKVGEGFVNPIGYYEALPRFSWQLPKNIHIPKQTAYQIQVAENKLFTAELLWDSGKVKSNSTSWVKYQGEPLRSRQALFWRVRTWNENRIASDWSAPQSIEMGLLSNQDWRAKWIAHRNMDLSLPPSQESIATPQYLRKDFGLDNNVKHVTKARLYVTAKGLFKAFVNGKQVAPEDTMTPGWTPYKKRIETLTYDVTEFLQSEQNTVAATLAGGWYSGRIFAEHDTDHRIPPRFLAQLEITYSDGSEQMIASDETWQATQLGPIRFASIYDGEKYHQALEMPGWNDTGFSGESWTQVLTEPLSTDIALTPKRHNPVRFIETLTAKKIVKADAQSAVYDFGQNMVGVPTIKLPMIAGETIQIRFAEALHKGEFYSKNYRSAHSTDYYTASQTGVIHYQPSFTYHGYRYIEISGFDASKTPQLNWVKAQVQHSDIPIANSFTSSHGKLNQLTSNIVWGLRSNFFDIPLDCPQRDERLAWTGDAQVFVTPSMYMADSYPFWSAWLQSMREEQRTNGGIPNYIPYAKWLLDWPSAGWGDAATIIPWELYIMTGDKQILQDNYAMMKAWVNYHTERSNDGISKVQTLGDWLQPFSQAKDVNRGDTAYSIISTAFYARSTELTLKAAKVLKKTKDVSELSRLHKQIKLAFRHQLFDKGLNIVDGKATQTSYLLGLAYDLFDTSEVPLAQQKLIAQLKKSDNHLRTGFIGTPLLASVLQAAGRTDLVYELLFKESYPSWLYSINNGATTTWERWNSYTLKEGFNDQGMNSLNHYAYGSIARWFYEGILGIQPQTAGFKSVKIAPQLGGQLSHAKGFYETPQGLIKVAWSISDGVFTLDVSVPNNTLAELILPDKVKAGTAKLNGRAVFRGSLPNLSAGNYRLIGNI